MKQTLLVVITLFGGSLLATAQDSRAIADAFAKHWKTSKDFTIAVLDKMPAGDFSFKASPAEMTFGEMASHIGDADFSYCSRALGSKAPAKGTDFTKDAAIKHVSEAFDFCIAGIEKLTDAELAKTAGKGTAFDMLLGGFTHTAHHRAALEVYLRLKGITPPQYQF